MTHVRRETYIEMIDMLRDGRERTIVVDGRSMIPSLRPGDEIEVSSVRRRPRVGEIIVYPYDERLIVHRVIEVGRDWIRTAGDALTGPGERVPLRDVFGIATLRRRGTSAPRPLRPSLWRALRARAVIALRFRFSELAHGKRHSA